MPQDLKPAPPTEEPAPWEQYLFVQVSTEPRPAALVAWSQLDDLRRDLLPGDILLTRREWFLGDVGLPGYWDHAAVYIGTPEERARYFGSDDLEQRLNTDSTAAYWQSLRADGGRPRRVVDPIERGAALSSLERSASADCLAVLRPRVPKSVRRDAVAKAFGWVGRASPAADLVYGLYPPGPDAAGLHPPAPAMKGWPAQDVNGLARKFDLEFGLSSRELEFVAFLDGREAEQRAVRSTAEAFRDSWRRPRWRLKQYTAIPSEAGAATQTGSPPAGRSQ